MAATLACAAVGFADDDILVQCPTEIPLACINECEAWGECIVRCDVLGRCDRDTEVECWFQATDFQRCLDANAPDVPVPTDPAVFIPPGACPAGQHSHAGNCHADHVCGGDEIGGGSAECQECGAGQVPNPEGTACVRCDYGESGSGGTCNPDPCGLPATDTAATTELWYFNQREPFERGFTFVCEGDTIRNYASAVSPPGNACTVTATFPAAYASCWSGHSARPDPCNLASIHTHPYFTEADEGTMCHGWAINEARAKRQNNLGMEFSQDDFSADVFFGVDGYLGVSDRSCAKANRVTSFLRSHEVVAGSCTRVPLPHKKWGSKP